MARTTLQDPLTTRVHRSSAVQPRRGLPKGRAPRGTSRVTELSTPSEAAVASVAEKHLSENTRDAYRKQFNKFIEYCKRFRADGEEPEEEERDDDEPNGSIHSNFRLDLSVFIQKYLVAKFEEGAAGATIYQIYSAIKKWYEIYYKRFEPWQQPHHSGEEYRGNPAHCLTTRQVLDSFKHAARDEIKQQSRALHSNHLLQVVQWVRQNNGWTETKKLMTIALYAVAFHCWFRIEEVVRLRIADVEEASVTDEDQTYRFLVINLNHRKTDQDGEGTYRYEFHDESDDRFFPLTWLRDWLRHYRQVMAGAGVEALEDSWFLFPSLRNGSLAPTAALNAHDTVSKELNSAALSLGIIQHASVAKYSLHCFRRGGAQHRFFHPKKPWPLAVVRRWGGWSKSEGTKTLINYLLNEYESREEYIGDMTSPYRRDLNRSILNQDIPEENEDAVRLSRNVSCLVTEMAELQASVSAIATAIQDVQNFMRNALQQPVHPMYPPQPIQLFGPPQHSAISSVQQPASQGPPLIVPNTAASKRPVLPRATTYLEAIEHYTTGHDLFRAAGIRYGTKKFLAEDKKRFSMAKNWYYVRSVLGHAWEECNCDQSTFERKFNCTTKTSITAIYEEIKRLESENAE